MRRPRPAALALLGLLVALVLGAATSGGCTAEDKVLATDFFTSYFQDRLLAQEGGTGMAAALALTGRSGDPTTDAALQVKDAVENIGTADAEAARAETARTAGDYATAFENIRAAIKLRPQDLSYRWKLATMQIENGEPVKTSEGLDRETLAKMSTMQRLAALSCAIDEYRASRERIRRWPSEKRGQDDRAFSAADMRLVDGLEVAYSSRALIYRELGLGVEADADERAAEGYASTKP